MMTMRPEELRPGAYVKGNTIRNCLTRADVVAARFEGFIPASEQTAETADYRDLQAQAKALGIPANQSADALETAILKALEAPQTVDGQVDGETTQETE